MVAEWERCGLLKSLSDGSATISFSYDGKGLRRTKKVGDVTTTYMYVDGKIISETDGTNYIIYYYDAEGILGINLNGRLYMFRKNVFGDVTHIFSEGGELVGKYSYTAYGECTIELDVNGIATLNPIRYRSYYYDEETGLYYLKSRYYDPEVGRFISIDSIDYVDPDTINGLNLYAYCLNNPVMLTDETGTMPNWLKWLIGGVVIIGLAIATVATGGAAAGVAGFIVAGALKGAVIGAVSSVLVSGTIQGIVSSANGNSFWAGFANGAADGFMSGAIIGGITGAISSSIQVANAAKMWDKGTYSSSFRSMKNHYQRKIVQPGLNKGYDIVKYTNDALTFANRNASILSYVPNYKGLQHAWTLNVKFFGYGWNELYTSVGKIITFGIW